MISSVKWVDYLTCHRKDVCDYSPSWAPPPGFPNSSSSEAPNSSVPPSGLLSGTQSHNPHLLDQSPELPLDVAPSLPSNTVTKFRSFSQQRAQVASSLTKLQALQECAPARATVSQCEPLSSGNPLWLQSLMIFRPAHQSGRFLMDPSKAERWVTGPQGHWFK